MNRKEFGDLVRALREQNIDADGRLFTQKMLADKTGLTYRVIRNIESGKKKHIDGNTLNQLATGLHLNAIERRRLFAASIDLDHEENFQKKGDPKAELETLKVNLNGVRYPLFVLDGYGDVLIANKALLGLLGVSDHKIKVERHQLGGLNSMRFIFDEDLGFQKRLKGDWEKQATYNMLFFRGLTILYRHKPYFSQLMDYLRSFRLFEWYWDDVSDVDVIENLNQIVTYTFRDLELGILSYISMPSIIVTSAGNLHSSVYLPKNKHTARMFEYLAINHGTEILNLSDWPEKKTL